MLGRALSLAACGMLVHLLPCLAAAEGPWLTAPGNPGRWQRFERVRVEPKTDSVVVTNGYIASEESYGDAEIALRLRAPESAKELQVWFGFRVRDRNHRYVAGLRGGNNNHLYLARYAPDANARFLGIAPLEFKPEIGKWYTVRVVTSGKRILIFLNDEKLPRINVEDDAVPWQEGRVALGGGYLPGEYTDLKVMPLTDGRRAEIAKLGEKVVEAPSFDREARRKEQRAAYKPFAISELDAPRTEISLAGDWLFKPDQEHSGGSPIGLDAADQDWHVIDVPSLWTPTLAWLHGEEGFNKLKGVSRMKGVSDKAYLREMQRLDGYTFDWKKTQGAWYRHYIDLPAAIQGRKVTLHFDAIATISQVWVNGKIVGGHLGMFGDLDCDITAAIRPGRNVIVVHASRNEKKKKDAKDKPSTTADDFYAVANQKGATLSDKVRSSLPTGFYGNQPGGIWQPVKLVITDPVSISDIFVQPSLDAAKVEIEVSNGDSVKRDVTVGYKIVSKGSDKALVSNEKAVTLDIPASGQKSLTLVTPKVAPKLWTPAEPNLYQLEIQLRQDGKVIDRRLIDFGFRTFAVKGNQLLLNGKPHWLRGTSLFPNHIRPNDTELARTVVRKAKEANIDSVRIHVSPMTEAWADAADQLGLLVSYEGTWPWLMLSGDVPDADLLRAWKDEFAELIRKYRNHPSLVLWTINNEMKFYHFDEKKPELLKQKWAVVSDMIQTVRQIDPTRPIVADSGYVRRENMARYNDVVVPNRFDDGDVDDVHRYYGWYNESFMNLFDGRFGGRLGLPDRPLLSQELSTGYPRNDDGLPTRAYLFNHFTPQALVGQFAYEHNDPAIFLSRQTQMTKELGEVIRRTNHDSTAGIMPFAFVTWLRDSFDKDLIQPIETYYGLQRAMSPVLVSVELFGRHFYAGRTITPRVCVVNDSEQGQDFPASQLEWEVVSGDNRVAKGSRDIPAVPYYQTCWTNIEIALPSPLPTPRTNAKLKVRLAANGKTLSENQYDLIIAEEAWARNAKPHPGVVVHYQPKNQSDAIPLPPTVEKLGSLHAIKSTPPRALIVSDAEVLDAAAIQTLRNYAGNGGRVLLLHPGKNLEKILPGAITHYRKIKGEIVNLAVPESPVFDGIEPLDLSWFEIEKGKFPYACNAVYQVDRANRDVTVLADFCEIHGYLNKPDDIYKFVGTPLIEARVGKGMVLASEMMVEAAPNDPIAQRVLSNLVNRLVQSGEE